jgi:hypothetical protein
MKKFLLSLLTVVALIGAILTLYSGPAAADFCADGSHIK